MTNSLTEPSQHVTSHKLRILQINLNKSEKAHLELINARLSKKYDIVLIQEPHTTKFNNIRTPPNFRLAFPPHCLISQDPIHSVIWINRRINTNNWTSLDIPDISDIMAIQLTNQQGVISIFNIYNDCNHIRNKIILHSFITNNRNKIIASANHNMIWAGNFNRHHPLWDNDNNTHLFTLDHSANLIDLITTYDLNMTLAKGIPMLQHMVTKKYSRPNKFFITNRLINIISNCKVDPTLRPPSTNHFPIITTIQLHQPLAAKQINLNYKATNWTTYKAKLQNKLNNAQIPQQIQHPTQIKIVLDSLTKAIQDTTKEVVPQIKTRPDIKRWWNSDLTNMRKKLNRLRNLSYQFRAITNHYSHKALKCDSNIYGKAIVKAK